MHEPEITDCLDLMLDSIKLIEKRFLKVGSPGEVEDHLKSRSQIIHNDATPNRSPIS